MGFDEKSSQSLSIPVLLPVSMNEISLFRYFVAYFNLRIYY